MNGINRHEEYPYCKTENPRVRDAPELQDQLGGGKVGGNGNGIIKPIVPREGETVSRGEKPGGVGVE
jgi:hypothetical protein